MCVHLCMFVRVRAWADRLSPTMTETTAPPMRHAPSPDYIILYYIYYIYVIPHNCSIIG